MLNESVSKTIVFVDSGAQKGHSPDDLSFIFLAQMLQQVGHKVVLIAPNESRRANAFREIGCTTREFHNAYNYNPLAISHFQSYFRGLRVDVVVIKTIKDLSTAGIAARLAGVKKILFQPAYPALLQKFKHKMLLPFFDFLIASSEHEATYYQALNWHLESCLHIVPHGLDLSRISERKLPAKRWHPVQIVGVGQLNEMEDVSDCLAVIGLLQKDWALKAHLIGDGSAKELIEKNSHDLQLNVTIHTEFEIQSRLRKADIFLSTSTKYGIDEACVLAMAEGIPVICIDNGIHHELIDHGVDGFVFEPGTIYEMTECIAFLLHDITKYNAVSKAAQKKAREIFDGHKMVTAFKAIIDAY